MDNEFLEAVEAVKVWGFPCHLPGNQDFDEDVPQ